MAEFAEFSEFAESSVSGRFVLKSTAEGHGRRTEVEFANFLNIARGSAIEVRSHLYVDLDLEYITKRDFDNIDGSLNEISKMTISLAQYLRK